MITDEKKTKGDTELGAVAAPELKEHVARAIARAARYRESTWPISIRVYHAMISIRVYHAMISIRVYHTMISIRVYHAMISIRDYVYIMQ